jgi:hypothetical protein
MNKNDIFSLFFTKSENRMVEQVLPGVAGSRGWVEKVGKECGSVGV